jgi:hypothetical protein
MLGPKESDAKSSVLSPRYEEQQITIAPSNNPGGGGVFLQPGTGAALSSIWGYFAEFYSRKHGMDTGYFVVGSMDKQHDPPLWMEDKDKTIDGIQIDKSMRGESWWEKRYARELAIGELRMKHKDNDFTLEQHDVVGAWRQFMRWAGYYPEALKNEDYLKQGEAEYEAQMRAEKIEREEKSRDWKSFMMEAYETDKPLATLVAQYRNVYDVYGLDEYLDGGAAFMWLMFKIGCFLGVGQGGWRALKLLHVDAHFLQVSGIGVLAFINTSILAGCIKWAGNTALCSAMFLLGDRAVWMAKGTYHKLIMKTPGYTEPQRTPINYAVGLAGSFGVAGILPWWMLGDFKLGIRYTSAAASLGLCVGYAAGLAINNMIALNLGRLDFTNNQFRSYKSMLKVEKIAYQNEVERRKRLARAIEENGATAGPMPDT